MNVTPSRSRHVTPGYASPLNRAGADLVAANWSRTLRSYNGPPPTAHSNDHGPSHRRRSTVKEYVSDIILAGAIHNRQITRFGILLRGCVALLRLLYRIRRVQRARALATDKNCTGLKRRASQVERDWALKQVRLASLKRESGLEAAAVGLARLKRLQAASRLQATLEGKSGTRREAATRDGTSTPARPTDWWESEQTVLRAGLPPACDWDTLHTRTVTALGGPPASPVSLHLATAYLVSMPYAWERESGTVASLADMQGWLSSGTPLSGSYSAWGESCEAGQGGGSGHGADTQQQTTAGSWVVYEPYFVLRWIPLSSSTAGLPLALSSPVDTVVTLTQLEAMAASGQGIGVGVGVATGAADAQLDWPCTHIGPDVSSLCAEASRAYMSRYGDFCAAWAAWWAAIRPSPPAAAAWAGPAPDAGPSAEELYSALEETDNANTWSSLQTCEAATSLPGAIASPQATGHMALPAHSAHMASPDMVSPGAVARAAARVRTQLESESQPALSPAPRYIEDAPQALAREPSPPPSAPLAAAGSSGRALPYSQEGAGKRNIELSPLEPQIDASSSASQVRPRSSSWGLAWVRQAGWQGMLAALSGLGIGWAAGKGRKTRESNSSGAERRSRGRNGEAQIIALSTRPAHEGNSVQHAPMEGPPAKRTRKAA